VFGSRLLVGLGSRVAAAAAGGGGLLAASDAYLSGDAFGANWTAVAGAHALPALDYGNALAVSNGSVYVAGAAGAFRWRAPLRGDDASLASVATSAGPLLPPFSPSVTVYNVYTAFGCSAASLLLQPSDSFASSVRVAVNGSGVVYSPVAGRPLHVTLPSAVSIVSIAVTSADASATQTYLLYFIQGPCALLGRALYAHSRCLAQPAFLM